MTQKIFSLALGLIFLLGASPVLADSTTLSVSPPVVEILLSPGKPVTQTFNLKATGDDLVITPELHLVKPTGSNGHVNIDPSPLNTSSLPLTVDISGPQIAPSLTFTATATDLPLDVYLALVFKVQTNASTTDSITSDSVPGISSLILLTINPSLGHPIDLEIEDFTSPLVHDPSKPLIISPTLTNHADIMIRPSGKYEIFGPTGQMVKSISLYQNLILGRSSRALTGESSPLTWDPSWTNLGPHRLRLTITTQGGTKLTEVERVVWLIPIRLILLGIVAIILSLTLLLKRSKFKTV